MDLRTMGGKLKSIFAARRIKKSTEHTPQHTQFIMRNIVHSTKLTISECFMAPFLVLPPFCLPRYCIDFFLFCN